MSALAECITTVPHTFEHNGKTYTMRLVTQKVKVEFEKHLFKKARELAKELKDEMESNEYKKHLGDLNDKYLTGEYTIESPLGLKYLDSPTGRLYFASLLCGCSEDEIIPILADQAQEVSALIKVVMEESFPLKKSAAAVVAK